MTETKTHAVASVYTFSSETLKLIKLLVEYQTADQQKRVTLNGNIKQLGSQSRRLSEMKWR